MARKLAVAVLDDLGLHGPAATLGERPGRGIRIVAVALLLLLASGFFSFYLQTSPPLLGGVITLVLEAAGLWLLLSRRWETREVVLLAVPSIWMALSLVLGFHVVVENGYLGILTQNYLKPAGLADLFALVFMAGGIWVMAAGFYTLVVAVRARFRDRTIKMVAPRALPVAALTLAIFVCWLPYLLTYFPGFIFPDSSDSIQQALGNRPLNNHHPVAYTMFLRLCFFIGSLLGGGTQLGVVIYTVVQMLLLAASLAYLSCWVACRMGWTWRAIVVFGLLFALNGYVGSFSITMWKDPLFCAAWVVLSCMLADVAFERGEAEPSPLWQLAFVLVGLVGVFCRNNGPYSMGASALVMGVLWFFERRRGEKRPGYARVTVLAAALTLVALVVTGPVYRAMGVEEERAEALGIPLNQMARVTAYNAPMTEADRVYMNMLIPLDYYFGTYRPCCVDQIKWSPYFHAEMLERDFFSHWLSMGAKNPKLYFESWVLQTHGFWTINCAHINDTDWNISQGAPYNTGSFGSQEMDALGIHFSKLMPLDDATERFPVSNRCVPIGWILWGLVFLVFFACLRRRCELLLGIVPSLGVIFTLLVASPIWYWPRYAAVMQLLIPLYLVLLWEISADN